MDKFEQADQDNVGVHEQCIASIETDLANHALFSADDRTHIEAQIVYAQKKQNEIAGSTAWHQLGARTQWNDIVKKYKTALNKIELQTTRTIDLGNPGLDIKTDPDCKFLSIEKPTKNFQTSDRKACLRDYKRSFGCEQTEEAIKDAMHAANADVSKDISDRWCEALFSDGIKPMNILDSNHMIDIYTPAPDGSCNVRMVDAIDQFVISQDGKTMAVKQTAYYGAKVSADSILMGKFLNGGGEATDQDNLSIFSVEKSVALALNDNGRLQLESGDSDKIMVKDLPLKCQSYVGIEFFDAESPQVYFESQYQVALAKAQDNLVVQCKQQMITAKNNPGKLLQDERYNGMADSLAKLMNSPGGLAKAWGAFNDSKGALTVHQSTGIKAFLTQMRGKKPDTYMEVLKTFAEFDKRSGELTDQEKACVGEINDELEANGLGRPISDPDVEKDISADLGG